LVNEDNTTNNDDFHLTALFNDDNTPLLSVDHFVTRDELIALQRDDTALGKFFELAKADH